MSSELAAAVVLKRTNKVRPGEIELLDTATACEAHDLVRPSPSMEALQHVAERLFAHRAIHLIHPHAPGTPDHDPAELSVYTKLLKSHTSSPRPDYYAVKGALGHGLGAAGLVSLVIACLCAKAEQRPPMPWLQQPIDSSLNSQAATLSPSTAHAIFASGFAGHIAGAVIQRK